MLHGAPGKSEEHGRGGPGPVGGVQPGAPRQGPPVIKPRGFLGGNRGPGCPLWCGPLDALMREGKKSGHGRGGGFPPGRQKGEKRGGRGKKNPRFYPLKVCFKDTMDCIIEWQITYRLKPLPPKFFQNPPFLEQYRGKREKKGGKGKHNHILKIFPCLYMCIVCIFPD